MSLKCFFQFNIDFFCSLDFTRSKIKPNISRNMSVEQLCDILYYPTVCLLLSYVNIAFNFAILGTNFIDSDLEGKIGIFTLEIIYHFLVL